MGLNKATDFQEVNMKFPFKKLLALFLCAALFAVLPGCSSIQDILQPFKADNYVRYTLDATYKADFTEYCEQVHISEDEARQNYLDGIQSEIDKFAKIYSVKNIPEASKERLAEFYKKVYAKASYEVKNPSKKDGVYYVEVTVNPIDLFQISFDEIQKFVSDFNNRVVAGEFNEYTDDQFEEYYINGILDICLANLDSSGYTAPKVTTVRVKKNESDGIYYLVNEDLYELYQTIIEYQESN